MDCVEFEGYRDAKGYGRVMMRNPRRVERAHRVTWTETHGPIPVGMVVRHRCDNPACVRVDHLQLGTKADNNRDMVERGRHANQKKTSCVNGHPFDVHNTRILKDGRRECIACRRENLRRNRAIRKAG